jgi:hypothetical protein
MLHNKSWAPHLGSPTFVLITCFAAEIMLTAFLNHRCERPLDFWRLFAARVLGYCEKEYCGCTVMYNHTYIETCALLDFYAASGGIFTDVLGPPGPIFGVQE